MLDRRPNRNDTVKTKMSRAFKNYVFECTGQGTRAGIVSKRARVIGANNTLEIDTGRRVR